MQSEEGRGDIELIDAGDGRRLERYGPHVVDRPARGAQGPRLAPERWRDADLRYDAGAWTGSRGAEPWTVAIDGLTLELRTTTSGQLGVFPEHLHAVRAFLAGLDGRPPARVLDLFAYTGLTTLALAGAGCTVTHVDAQRSAVAWARRNAELSGLADRPIRWIVDDALAFARREERRGSRYDAIVLDPPTYGHGAGRTWQLERDLPDLLDACASVSTDDTAVLLTAHSEGVEADDLVDVVSGAFPRRRPPSVSTLRLHATSGAWLDLGMAVLLR